MRPGWLDELTAGGVPPSLVVVRGPRGSGKTTAIAGWLRREPAPRHHHVWVSAPQRSVAATEYWDLVRRRVVGAGLDELDGGDWSLLDRELGRRRSRLVLVLDDVDRIRGRELADQVVALSAELEQVSVVAISRAARDLQTVAAVGGATVIGARRLAWGRREVRDLARELGTVLTEPEADRVAAAALGWPALALTLVRELGRTPSGLLTMGTESYEAYLRVATQDPELASWESVAALGLAGEVDAAVAADLLGAERARETLAALAALGVDAPESETGTPRALPQPLADVLSSILAERNPVRHREVSAAVARSQDRRAAPASALTHALAAGDLALAADVLRTHGSVLLADHRELAGRALRQLPEELVGATAQLLVARDYVLNVGTPERARSAYLADQLVPEPASAQDRRLSLQEVLSLRDSGLYEGARRVAEQRDLGATIAASGWTPAVVADVPAVLLSWARSEMGAAAGPVPTFAYTEAYRWARHVGNDDAAMEAAAGAALSHALAGQPVSARAWLAQLDPGTSGAGAQALAAAARVVVRTDALEGGADLLVDDAWEHAGILSDLLVVTLMADADTALRSGETARAVRDLERYRVTRGEASAPGLAETVLVAALLELHLAGGDLERARRLLAEVDTDGDRLPVQRAQLDLQQGSFDAVRALVRRVDPRTPRQTVQLALAAASAALRCGHDGEASDYFHTAVSVARRTGLLRPFLLLPGDDLQVLGDGGRALTGSLRVLRDQRHGLLGEVGARVVLTPRELEVLSSIAGGAALPAVASRLFVSPNTVKSQLRMLYRKLGVSGRDEAVRRARELGLIPPEGDVATGA